MSHLADLHSHPGLPGIIKQVLEEQDARISALEAQAAADAEMLAVCRFEYARMKNAPTDTGTSEPVPTDTGTSEPLPTDTGTENQGAE